MLVYSLGRKTGKISGIRMRHEDEKPFEELFPDKKSLN
jgi:hypothetical protein